jgi:hypothetical protein
MGSTVASAVWVGNCSASDFGTSSPSTTCTAVSPTRTMIAAVEVDAAASTPNDAATIGASDTAIVA